MSSEKILDVLDQWDQSERRESEEELYRRHSDLMPELRNAVDDLRLASAFLQPVTLRPHDLVQGRYLVVRRIGSGGFGTVFYAIDRQNNNAKLAIKVARLEKPGSKKSLERELELAAQVQDVSTVASVREWGIYRDCPYIVYDFVEGTSLKTEIDRVGPPSDRDAVIRIAVVVAQLASTLEVLHTEHRQAHCDIKPANIILSSHDVPWLTDLASSMRLSPAERMGQSYGQTKGYIAPEVAEGALPDGRSDVFSLGVVLRQWLLGHSSAGTPNTANSNFDAFPSIVPVELIEISDRAVASDPGTRLTAGEFEKALEDWLTKSSASESANVSIFTASRRLFLANPLRGLLRQLAYLSRLKRWLESDFQQYSSLPIKLTTGRASNRKSRECGVNEFRRELVGGRNCVLLGEAGSGKTVTLKSIVYLVARNAVRDTYVRLLVIALLVVPILIGMLTSNLVVAIPGFAVCVLTATLLLRVGRLPFPVFIEGKSVPNELERGLESLLGVAHASAQQISVDVGANIIWILDGFDEASPLLRRRMLNTLQSSPGCAGAVHAIAVSSRSAYRPAADFSGSTTWTMMPLCDDEIEKFVENQSHTDPVLVLGELSRNGLLRPDATGMARRPLELSMLLEAGIGGSGRLQVIGNFCELRIQREISSRHAQARITAADIFDVTATVVMSGDWSPSCPVADRDSSLNYVWQTFRFREDETKFAARLANAVVARQLQTTAGEVLSILRGARLIDASGYATLTATVSFAHSTIGEHFVIRRLAHDHDQVAKHYVSDQRMWVMCLELSEYMGGISKEAASLFIRSTLETLSDSVNVTLCIGMLESAGLGVDDPVFESMTPAYQVMLSEHLKRHMHHDPEGVLTTYYMHSLAQRQPHDFSLDCDERLRFIPSSSLIDALRFLSSARNQFLTQFARGIGRLAGDCHFETIELLCTCGTEPALDAVAGLFRTTWLRLPKESRPSLYRRIVEEGQADCGRLLRWTALKALVWGSSAVIHILADATEGQLELVMDLYDNPPRGDVDLLLEDATWKDAGRTRGNITCFLTSFGSDGVSALAARLTSDCDDLKATHIVASLRRFGLNALPVIVREMRRSDAISTSWAVEFFQECQEKASTCLIPYALDESARVRVAIATALGGGNVDSFVSVLQRLLHDDDSSVVIAAMEALAGVTTPDREVLLQVYLTGVLQQDENVMAQSLRTLSHFDGKIVETCIASFLHTSNIEVRCAAIEAAAAVGMSNTIEVIVEFLQDKSRQVREASADAIGELQAESAVDDLIRCLVHFHSPAAARALGKLRQEKAVSFLLKKLQIPSRWNRFATIRGIPNSLAMMSKGGDTYTYYTLRNECAVALGRIGGEAAKSALWGLLDDNKGRAFEFMAVSWETLFEAIGLIADRGSVPHLISRRPDTVPTDRFAAWATALAKSGGDSVTEELARFLNDSVSFSSAVDGLTLIGTDRAIRFIGDATLERRLHNSVWPSLQFWRRLRRPLAIEYLAELELLLNKQLQESQDITAQIQDVIACIGANIHDEARSAAHT